RYVHASSNVFSRRQPVLRSFRSPTKSYFLGKLRKGNTWALHEWHYYSGRMWLLRPKVPHTFPSCRSYNDRAGTAALALFKNRNGVGHKGGVRARMLYTGFWPAQYSQNWNACRMRRVQVRFKARYQAVNK